MGKTQDQKNSSPSKHDVTQRTNLSKTQDNCGLVSTALESQLFHSALMTHVYYECSPYSTQQSSMINCKSVVKCTGNFILLVQTTWEDIHTKTPAFLMSFIQLHANLKSIDNSGYLMTTFFHIHFFGHMCFKKTEKRLLFLMQESILLCLDIVVVKNFTFIPKSSTRIIS